MAEVETDVENDVDVVPVKAARKTKPKAKPVKVTKGKAAKVTKGKATKAGKGKRAPSTPDGLNGSHVKILKALSNKDLTRGQLKDKTGIERGWSKLLGASTKEGLGTAGETSLEGRGLVNSAKIEGQRSMVYSITSAGKKALANATK